MFRRIYLFIKKHLTFIVLGLSGVLLLLSQLKLQAKHEALNNKISYSSGLSYFMNEVKIKLPLQLKSQKHSDSIVYLRLMNNGCNDCTDSLLKNAGYLSSRIGSDHIAVLVGGKFKENDFYMFKRLNKFAIEHMYYVTSGFSDLDSLNTSYYFIIKGQPGVTASSIFLPDPTGNPDLNRKYLQWVIRSF